MSKAKSEKLPPKPRPHSFDIGVHQHQGKDTKEFTPPKGIGVYKSGSGTYMFSSTSMSAALDNLQYYPKATNAQLTDEHRATIRETVIDQLAPLRSFPKAHTYPGQVVIEPYSPASSQSDRRSAEIRRSADHRRSADLCPRYPLTAFPSPSRSAVPFGANSAWSPATQIAMTASRGSTDTAAGNLTQEQLLANVASSAFFAPSQAKPVVPKVMQEAPNPAAASLLAPSPPQMSSQRAAELANAAASSFFAPATLGHAQQPSAQQAKHAQQQQYGSNLQGPSMHRPTHPPLHNNSPTGAAKYSRAMRGSFEQPQARARGSFEQTKGSSEAGLRSSFDEILAGNSANHPSASGRSSFDQLQSAARNSFGQLHARNTVNQIGLDCIPEQQTHLQASPVSARFPYEMATVNPFSQIAQNPSQNFAGSRYPLGQFGNSQPHPGTYPYSLARASCDYPQAVANPKAATGDQGTFLQQTDTTASRNAQLARQSFDSSRALARLEEAAQRQAAAAAFAARNFPPKDSWQQQQREPDAGSMISPFAQWPVQTPAGLQSFQPQALQMQALNRLNAMREATGQQAQSHLQQPQGTLQQHQGTPADWRKLPHQPQRSAAHSGFPTTNKAPGSGTVDSYPVRLSNGSQSSQHSRPDSDSSSAARQALSELGVNDPGVQGAWGTHLDSGANAPIPKRGGGSGRGQSYNPFLQPQSTFSIREAKLQLQNPAPSMSAQGEAMPRVDTFASNLHDAWGAHAQHHSPPASEANYENPPRLSTESIRSTASAASKASSGGSRPTIISRQSSGRLHHGYGYDPGSDGWKVDCSSGTQRSFSTYTGQKPEGSNGRGIIATTKELLAEAANASRTADASTARTSQDGSSGITPLLDILVQSTTPLPKKRRVLETLTFLAANAAIAYSICDQGGVPILLQLVAEPNDIVQLEAAEALQALMMHQCAQIGFDHSDGLFKLVPMLAEHRDPPTHLAGLHILASFIYSRGRSSDTMAKQLKEAGLYDAALMLLKVHSHVIGQNQSAAHQDTLEWLEASQTDSPMASLPEDHPLDAELGDRPALTVGNTSQPKGNDSAADLAFQTDSGTPSGHAQLTTAQTVPLPNARPRTPPAVFRARRIGGGSFPPEMSEGTLDHAIDDASRQLMEEDAERLSGDVTLADQVVLAALEVLFKLSASQQHLQFFRPELLMEALNAQLQHGCQPRGLSRAIQLLQACTQQPSLLAACADSGCIGQLIRLVKGSSYIAALASSALGAMIQTDTVRAVILQGQGARQIVHMLTSTNSALPGALYLMSCLAEHTDSRQGILQAGVVPALLRLASRTHDPYTCASATSLVRLLTHSSDRRSTDGIHGRGLDLAGKFSVDAARAGASQARVGSQNAYQHAGPAFQGFFQL